MRWRRRLQCSFCGKNDSEVAKLMTGPRVLICDQCVAAAARIMAGSDTTTAQQHTPQDKLVRRVLRKLRFKEWMQRPFHLCPLLGVRPKFGMR